MIRSNNLCNDKGGFERCLRLSAKLHDCSLITSVARSTYNTYRDNKQFQFLFALTTVVQYLKAVSLFAHRYTHETLDA